MKSNTFNYSLLAVGVAAVLGVSTGTNAATSGTVGETTTSVEINNVATADYKVANVDQPKVTSNSVKITVSEQVSFSLISNNADGSPLNDSNVNEEVAPNGIAVFKHTLTNTGNRADSYTLLLENVGGDNTNYDLDNSTVTFTVFTDGVAGTATTIPVALANSQPFTLEKGQSIEFSINAKTTGNKGGETQDLKLSATSTILTGAKTLVNTDNSITKLPTFNIVKTITNALDLNDLNDTATYQIVVKNPRVTNAANVDYSAAATNILIEDVLPAGLIVATPESTVTASNGSTTGAITRNSTGFTLTNANLAIDGTITIVLYVKRDPNVAPAAGALNHVKVTDDLDDNAATTNTLIDSTNSTVENVASFYPSNDTDYVDGTVAPGTNGDDSTQPLLTINRDLTLTQVTNKEIAPNTGTTATETGGQVTHQTIITNKGKDTEGDTANELTFTITDNDNGTADAINIVPGTVKITYTPTTGAAVTSPITPVNGVYDIHSALPGGIAPGGKVTISYNVSSNNAPLFTPAAGTTPTTEATVVTLIPVGEGVSATTIVPVTDTTTVKGLTLVKAQALDANCDNTIEGTFVTTDIGNVLPGQCVVYRINATNTSSTIQTANPTQVSGFDITNLLIADATSRFSAVSDYVVNTGKIKVGTATETNATKGTPTGGVDSIYANVTTLAPQESAVMTFRVKIKTAR